MALCRRDKGSSILANTREHHWRQAAAPRITPHRAHPADIPTCLVELHTGHTHTGALVRTVRDLLRRRRDPLHACGTLI